MLQLNDVVSGYGSIAVLHGVDAAITAGEIRVILGRNGVGKTTLLKTIAGNLPLTSGTIHLDDVDISRLAPYRRARRGIAYVPQGREIFPGLTVLDNLRVAFNQAHRGGASQAIDETLEEFPALKVKAKALGGSLSGGQQQILAFARALITGPRVLLLDEPSEGIQPSIVAEIADTIRRVAAERSIAVLVAEQNLDFVARVTSEVSLFDHGRFVRQIPVAELASDVELQHEYLGV